MKGILSLRKHGYLKTIGTLLIAMALIAGVVGCDGTPAPEYALTMAADPAAGGTATDETGTSPYEENTEVSIKAVTNAGYQFVKWTAPVGEFTDENAATTSFTMPAEDVIVTANFVGPLDHATAYDVTTAIPEYINEEVYLEDQFGACHAVIEDTAGFVIPAEKMYNDETTPVYNRDHCLTLYYISCEEEVNQYVVDIENQFGTQTLTVEGPYGLAVPTQNEGHEAPLGLDHYLLYEVIDYTYLDEISVTLNDEFLDEPMVSGIYAPLAFASPVRKTHGDEVTEIVNADVHGVFYATNWGDVENTVDVVNQFVDGQALEVAGPYALFVPSEKTDFKVKPLSHFEGYYVDYDTAPYMDQWVTLTDQFVEDFVAEVGEAIFFFNPTQKVYLDETTPIYDVNHHYAVYHLDIEEDYPVRRSVEVTNQFGTQEVGVFGPVALAVPTTKVEPGNHEAPECLDHLLLYVVEEGPYLDPVLYVDLADEFGADNHVTVYEYAFFANPVQKTDTTGVTEIQVGEHMLFYWMDGTTATYPQVKVDNQFAAGQIFDLGYPAELLGVPSQKNVPPTPPLDHFKCYLIDTGPVLEGVYVYLEDQFGVYEDVQVFSPWIFCNPVDKVHDTLTATSNPDNHLTVYSTAPVENYWRVTVDNQFGNGQEMIVVGPVGLVVPTQKVEPFYHDKPKYLNHYLLYYVEEGLNVTATVDLDDEFTGTAPDVEVTTPVFFATPAIKGHIDPILDPWDPEAHMVFYLIPPTEEFMPGVYVNNQFAPDGMALSLDPLHEQLLAVPSVKVSYEPYIPT